MICATLALLASCITTPAQLDTGWLSHYDLAPTVGTLHYRVEVSGELSRADVEWADTFIAVEHCDQIGRRGMLFSPGLQPRRVIVYDCAVRNDSDGARSWMRNNNILAEVDAFTLDAWGIDTSQGRRGTIVWEGE